MTKVYMPGALLTASERAKISFMAKIVENALVIYTDGACYPKGKGRSGGFGVLFLHFDDVGNEIELDHYVAPSLKGTTSQRMELEACVTALKRAPDIACYLQVHNVVVRTDSQYVVKYHVSALTHWRQNRWRNYAGKPVLNADLWREFVRAYEKIHKPVLIEKVKAHGKGLQKDPHNEKADKLAKASRDNPLKRSRHRSVVRRKLSPNKTTIGSIKPEGQTVTLRVIEAEAFRTQRTSKYRCEVMSPESPYFECVDFLYSEKHLDRGHTYEVTLNDDPRNPTILEVIREIEKEAADNSEPRDGATNG